MKASIHIVDISHVLANQIKQYAVSSRGLNCSYTRSNILPDGHAIYLLNLLLAFLQPRFDPSLQDDLLADEIEEGGEDAEVRLPSHAIGDDEFRPFVRRLPEWQFWSVSILHPLYCRIPTQGRTWGRY